MVKIFILALCFIPAQIFGQRDLTIITNDFNRDGVVDTLKSYYDGGSGFGGIFAKITNGKTQEIYELSNDGCFCEIRRTLLIPPELSKPENALFLEAMKKQLLPEKRSSPENSLKWIIEGSYSNVVLDSNQYFDLIIDPQTKWTNQPFKHPVNYYLEIEKDSLNKLYHTPYEAPEWYSEKDNKGFLVYQANNHYGIRMRDSSALSDSNATYQAFHTSHGVFVKKGNLHKWVFVSDFYLTGAPEKLRWESIQKVKLVGQYIILQQDLPPGFTNQLFVINLETGICGRLKYSLSDFDNDGNNTINHFLIEEESIILNDGQKTLSFQLIDIFKELETLYIK